MRTEEPRPVRLQDYRPPDWLIETVDLDVALHPSAATVRAKLKIKPNVEVGGKLVTAERTARTKVPSARGSRARREPSGTSI